MASHAGFRSGILLEGTFDINGHQCTVNLTSEALKWQPVSEKNEEERVIPVEEILSTTLSMEEAKSQNASILRLVYMEHHENQVVVTATVNMVEKTDICTTWSRRIQECIDAVPGRPNSILVLINPASGDKEGPELYKEKVAPVFLEASVRTQVIISESEDHAREVIRGYDLDSIDSIIAMGGDGIYNIIADALLQRQMKEAGLDLNDPDIDVQETCIPIGIMPCGSGNALAFQLWGTFDVESVTLGIVRGGRQKLPVQGVWSGGELVVYSFLFVGIGAVADWMYDAQNMRDKGKDRYQILLAQYNTKETTRSLDVTVDMMPSLLDSNSDTTNPANDDQLQQWQTYNQGRTPMLGAFITDFLGLKESKDVAHYNFTRLVVMKDWNGPLFLEHMKQLGSLMDPHASNFDGIQYLDPPCVEYKVTIKNPDEQQGRANMMFVDGEIYYCKQPNYHVKLFPGKMNLFASVAPDFMANNSPRIL